MKEDYCQCQTTSQLQATRTWIACQCFDFAMMGTLGRRNKRTRLERYALSSATPPPLHCPEAGKQNVMWGATGSGRGRGRESSPGTTGRQLVRAAGASIILYCDLLALPPDDHLSGEVASSSRARSHDSRIITVSRAAAITRLRDPAYLTLAKDPLPTYSTVHAKTFGLFN